MMKFIVTFDDYENRMVPTSFKVSKPGIENIADQFLRDLRKNYDLGVGKEFNPKKGNCAWYVQEFYQWAENNRTPVRIVYFPETEKAKDAHIAILVDDLVLDFAHKQFSKDKKEKYSILPLKAYKKYGYSDEMEVLDEVPSWIEDIYPADKK
jgi:hypothetical protein